MLNCVIVDDCSLAQMNLVNLCNKNKSLKLVGSFLCPEEALQFFNKNTESVDLLFLDVEMPVMSGLQFLDRLKSPPMVIFTTSNQQYAFDAFEYQAVDFLKKPISSHRFDQAVRKAIRLATLGKTNEMILSAQKLQEDKRHLISLLAHDLRNPLFALQIKATQLKMIQSQAKIALDIESAIDRIQQLTNLILQIEENSASEIYKLIRPVALKPLIEKVLEHLNVLVVSKKLKIGINEVVPDTKGQAEPILLEHIIENILSNAIKFSPNYGMIEIYIEKIEDGMVKVRIKDDGPGIPPEKLATLFDRKGPIADSLDESLGIGLSLSKRFAELMDVRLGVENSEGFGTTAYLDIKQSTN